MTTFCKKGLNSGKGTSWILRKKLSYFGNITNQELEAVNQIFGEQIRLWWIRRFTNFSILSKLVLVNVYIQICYFEEIKNYEILV